MSIKNRIIIVATKKIILAMFVFVLVESLHAQNASSSCSQSLKQAQKDYEKGNIERIKSQIENCVSSVEFSKIEQIQAYRLMILSFLYLDDQANSEKWMNDLLNFEPDYRPNKLLNPIEYIKLYESFNVIPWISLGLGVGINGSTARPIWNYNVGNNDVNSETKNSTNFSINIAAIADINIKKNLFLTTELQFAPRALRSEKQAFSSSTVAASENQTCLELPVSFKYIIGKGKLKAYIRAGGGINYILSASQNLTRIKNDGITVEYSGTEVNVKSSRNPLNIFALVGGGFMFKIGYGHLFVDARYQFGLSNIVKQSERYESVNARLTSYGYLDDDFAVNSIQISSGYIYSVFRVKKIRKKIITE